ncbi:MAG: transcription elongation factor [Thermoprotei archaeon]|nr:MAG: transcription elongation factor [Thermoprotei archaeon]
MGRRRKRRKIIRRPKKKIPKIFTCPNCGEKSVSVHIDKENGQVSVRCGICGLEASFEYTPVLQPVDYYGKFVDKFHTGEISVSSEVGEIHESTGVLETGNRE